MVCFHFVFTGGRVPVAHERFFTKEHVQTHCFAASEVLAEQAVHCLELVSELSVAGLSYQFKGGNSLLLILPRAQRFSIDVDIATDETRERIDQCLDTIVASQGVFTRWEKRQHKTKPWLPIASYYLFYRSHFAVSADTEPSIMLDVQLRRSPYKTAMKPVVCAEVYESSAQVDLPLPASIVGDKLLTVGPYTLGIPVGKGKQAQRLKHVFDISSLLRCGPELDDIRESMLACVEHENSLQERTTDVQAVMIDTLKFCGSVAPFVTRPPRDSAFTDVLNENIEGLPQFAEHLFDAGYDWRRLQLDMSRVALCIAAVCTPAVNASAFDSAHNGARCDFLGSLSPDFLAQHPEARSNWEWVYQWLGYNPLEIPA